MNLLNNKDCSKCENSLVYGNKDSYNIQCTSLDFEAKECFKQDGRYCASFCKCFKQSKKKRSGLINQSKALKFITAGKSEFIMHSTKTNEDFRFLITKQLSRNNTSSNKYVYFVNIIRGSDKLYAGLLWKDEDKDVFKFSHGKKGKVTSDSVDIKSLLFVLNKLNNNDKVENLELYSLGKCGCCGNIVTTDEEIENGLCKKCNS